MSAKESITSFFRRTYFRGWRKPGTRLFEKINVKESITSFFRRTGRQGETTFVGKLDGKLVGSSQPVIIFEYPHILHSAETVEDATTFLVKLNEGNAAKEAALYRYDTDRWQKQTVAG